MTMTAEQIKAAFIELRKAAIELGDNIMECDQDSFVTTSGDSVSVNEITTALEQISVICLKTMRKCSR